MKKQIKNKILSVLAVVSMLASLITALPVVAENASEFTFALEGGNATITGFDENYIGVLNIPDTLENYPVTKIGEKAFYKCQKITEVTIPDGVTSIGKGAFQDCSGMTKIDLPENLKEIDEIAFYGCKLLSEIQIPKSTMIIGKNAFSGCSTLKSIELSPNMTGISEGAFRSCSSLKSITIPKSIVSVGKSAFDGCKNLDDVYYEGTAEDWQKISINDVGNKKLLNATVSYSSASITEPATTQEPSETTPTTEPTEAPTPSETSTPAPIVTPVPDVTPVPNNNNNGGTTTIINNNTTNTIVTNNTETNNNITNNTITNNNITNNTNITNNIVNNVSLVLYIGKTTANVGGESVENDVAPIVRNDRTMLPARFVAEQLGAKVDWNQDLKQVIITKGDKLITIPIGSDKAYVNNVAQTLDSPAFVENDRTYTPVRFIAENLDADVQWNGDDQSVTITEK